MKRNQPGDTLVHRHQWIWSDRLQVSGIIDAVEERDHQLIPWSLKEMANHLNDHFQLCAAALCLEERTALLMGKFSTTQSAATR